MKVVGINFDHFHMGDLLAQVAEHPEAEIVGVSDEQPERMQDAVRAFGIDHQFTDYRECLERTQPDLVICCPAAAEHGEWTERIAAFKLPILMEKPMAASLAEADRMIAAMQAAGQPMAVNWPMVWYPGHVTAHRLINEGRIGKVREVHYYGGNRGPLYHVAGKAERSPTQADKAASWFYKRAQGGGALLDYLGYGTTLGTWFHGGVAPVEVTAMTDWTGDAEGVLEVDEHAVVVARYATGLSKFETRWGTFTDPWTHQPQPKCGFVIVGSAGTISSYDLEQTIRVQTADDPAGSELPVDELATPHRNPVEYFIHSLQTGTPVEGPLSLELSRTGQRIVDAAVQSAAEKRTVELPA